MTRKIKQETPKTSNKAQVPTIDCYPAPDAVFETSWEVCNKVGGIYTVLATKASELMQRLGENLIFIGPDIWTASKPSPYFVEGGTFLDDWAAHSMLPHGLTVRTGRWQLASCQPVAVLVDFRPMFRAELKDALYAQMWQNHGVDSLHAYGDYDEACAFASASALVIKSIIDHFASTRGWHNIVAHFDEWTTGMGLLSVRDILPDVATVFTTHATSIGRSICGNGKNLYQYFDGYGGDQMAAELNMQSKHSLEKAAAHAADAFTTVSDITADECAQLLEKRPDIVTPNGFDDSFVPKGPKYTAKRRAARQRLLEVASQMTGKTYSSDDTFIVGTAGRCEYRNKGLDMFIDSINAMPQMIADKQVLAFILVPGWPKAPNADLTACKFCTHELNNPGQDAVYRRLAQNNAEVQNNIIYVPCYLDRADGVLNMTYYDVLPALDASVFASYYEPWGYTPLESIAFGIPTITSSLAGFGRWTLTEYGNDPSKSGVVVVERTDVNYAQAVADIAKALTGFANLDAKSLKSIQAAARKTARKASWANFMTYYDDAYATAITKAGQRKK